MTTTTITTSTPVVINRSHGAYDLSTAAADEIARRKGLKLRYENGVPFVGETIRELRNFVLRNDPYLIAVVSEMGAAANGAGADLKVVYVMITIGIDNQDGMETMDISGGNYVG